MCPRLISNWKESEVVSSAALSRKSSKRKKPREETVESKILYLVQCVSVLRSGDVNDHDRCSSN